MKKNNFKEYENTLIHEIKPLLLKRFGSHKLVSYIRHNQADSLGSKTLRLPSERVVQLHHMPYNFKKNKIHRHYKGKSMQSA